LLAPAYVDSSVLLRVVLGEPGRRHATRAAREPHLYFEDASPPEGLEPPIIATVELSA